MAEEESYEAAMGEAGDVPGDLAQCSLGIDMEVFSRKRCKVFSMEVVPIRWSDGLLDGMIRMG